MRQKISVRRRGDRESRGGGDLVPCIRLEVRKEELKDKEPEDRLTGGDKVEDVERWKGFCISRTGIRQRNKLNLEALVLAETWPSWI